MRFSINKSSLQDALAVVMKGVASRSTIPALSGVLVTAEKDEIVLQTTDLTLSIQYSAPALIEEEGSVVLPGKFFFDIVKSLPDAAIHLELADDIAIITCDAASFSLKTLEREDFPGFPHVDAGQRIAIPFPTFSRMVKKVARVVSKDESRVILSGVLITVDEASLKMVATDSYRLAVTEAAIPDAAPQGFEVVIAGTFLQDIAALPLSEEDVTIAVAENQIVITYQGTVFINRRIEGTFPNYKQLLPQSHQTKAVIETAHLVAAIKRASLLIPPTSPVRFSLDKDGGVVQVSSTSQDVGSVNEVIPCEIEGDSMEIAFNYAYALDGLGAVDDEKVAFEAISSAKPGIFTSQNDDNYLYLIMPVRIS